MIASSATISTQNRQQIQLDVYFDLQLVDRSSDSRLLIVFSIFNGTVNHSISFVCDFAEEVKVWQH